jgi:hypothetical protein
METDNQLLEELIRISGLLEDYLGVVEFESDRLSLSNVLDAQAYYNELLRARLNGPVEKKDLHSSYIREEHKDRCEHGVKFNALGDCLACEGYT